MKEPAVRGDLSRAVEGWAGRYRAVPEAAFAWKSAMQTVRIVDKRRPACSAVILSRRPAAAMSFGRGRGGAFGLASLSVLFDSPRAQIGRMDMRQDLRHLELLKTWPVGVRRGARRALCQARSLPPSPGRDRCRVVSVAGRLPRGPRLARGDRCGRRDRHAALVLAQLTIPTASLILRLGAARNQRRVVSMRGQRLIMLEARLLLIDERSARSPAPSSGSARTIRRSAILHRPQLPVRDCRD
jgi:hypothetical protein